MVTAAAWPLLSAPASDARRHGRQKLGRQTPLPAMNGCITLRSACTVCSRSCAAHRCSVSSRVMWPLAPAGTVHCISAGVSVLSRTRFSPLLRERRGQLRRRPSRQERPFRVPVDIASCSPVRKFLTVVGKLRSVIRRCRRHSRADHSPAAGWRASRSPGSVVVRDSQRSGVVLQKSVRVRDQFIRHGHRLSVRSAVQQARVWAQWSSSPSPSFRSSSGRPPGVPSASPRPVSSRLHSVVACPAEPLALQCAPWRGRRPRETRTLTRKTTRNTARRAVSHGARGIMRASTLEARASAQGCGGQGRVRMNVIAAEPFGSALRAARMAAGLTQEALAQRAGPGVRSIQALERGGNRPHRDTVERLVTALGLRRRRAAASSRRPAPARQRHCSGKPADAGARRRPTCRSPSPASWAGPRRSPR